MEQRDCSSEFLSKTKELLELLSLERNTVERQVSLYHVRSLVALRIEQEKDEVGPTAFGSERSELLIDIFELLSVLGTEDLQLKKGEELTCSSLRTCSYSTKRSESL